MDRTIRVTGRGKLSVKPDSIRLMLTLTETRSDYEQAVKRSSEKTESLKDRFAAIGFERSALKTTGFNVEPQYESFRDENGDYKQRFTGYAFHHEMKIDFDADNALLGRVLAAVASSGTEPEFQITYTVKEPERAKNELLERAVADSKEKAAQLAKAAGVALGEITLIDYSWSAAEIVSRPMNRMAFSATSAEAGSFDMDVEPDDIDLSDTVTVVWRIGAAL